MWGLRSEKDHMYHELEMQEHLDLHLGLLFSDITMCLSLYDLLLTFNGTIPVIGKQISSLAV